VALLAACGPAWIEPGPRIAAPRLDGDQFVAGDGAALPLLEIAPEGPPRAAILALHSFGDFGGSFEELGGGLAAAGYLVYAPDQRGFGAGPHPGRWPGADALIADAQELLATLRAAHPPELPWYVIGESMGGSVALAAFAGGDAGLRGLVLIAPGVRKGYRGRVPYNLLYGAAGTLLPAASVAIEPERSVYTVAAQTRLAADPRVLRRVRADTYFGLLRLADRGSFAAERVTLPTLVQVGDADSFVPRSAICTLMRDLPEDRTVGRGYAGGVHRVLHQQDHAARLAQDILVWLDGATPATGPGVSDLRSAC
jgi:acylglycerol lipase